MATYKQTHHLTPPASGLQPPASARRGVILLVLLGMLALFGATALAFVIVASHGNRAAKSLQKVDRVMFAPREDLEETLGQIVHGPKLADLRSVLRGQSLLEDLYGNGYVNGWIINGTTVMPTGFTGNGNPKNVIEHAGATAPETDPLSLVLPPSQLPGTATPPASYQGTLAGGQIIEFTAGYTIPPTATTGGLDLSGNPIGTTNAPNTITIPAWFGSQQSNTRQDPANASNFLNNEPIEFQRRVGCVLTIKDCELSRLYGLNNKSTRIVGYRRQPMPPTGTPGIFYHRYQILPFEGIAATSVVNFFNESGRDLTKTPRDKVDFVVNGVPFSGMGAGYRIPRPPMYGHRLDPGSSANVLDGMIYASYDANNEFPYALLPNPTDPEYHGAFLPDPSYSGPNSPQPLYLSVYSANEDYDAADYQNMLLAMEHHDGIGMTLTRSPSLHRPELANYWLQHLATVLQAAPYGLTPLQAWAALLQPTSFPPPVRNLVITTKRRCLLRPLSEDHNAFDGSNAKWPNYADGDDISSFTLAQLQAEAAKAWGAVNLAPGATLPWDNGSGNDIIPWDVDNEGDGIPDSIWADLGFPVRTLADGRKYKPLAAILCIDLDGKVNLNTAGSVEQLYAAYAPSIPPGDPTNPSDPRGYRDDGTIYAQPMTEGNPPTAPASLSRGQGCGTAEINPLPVLNTTLYERLLLGVYTAGLDGRYGELDRRNPTLLPPGELRWPSPGFTPRLYNYYLNPPAPEALTIARLFNYPPNYWQAVNTGAATSYGSPLDLKGTLAIGLDFFGQPIYSIIGGMQVDAANNYQAIISGWNSPAWAAAAFDTPYELKLGPIAAESAALHAGIDSPFTIAELEPLLRRYDTDILRLPARLRQLVGAGPTSQYRLQVTTESWDLPVPGLAMSKELRDGWNAIGLGRPPQHISDVVAARVAANVTPPSPAPLPAGLTAVPAVDAPRVDMTRLLSTDVLLGLRMDLDRPFGNSNDDNTIDTNSDGIPDIGNGVVDEPLETGVAELAYRQAYARTLYVLMMALVDQLDPANQWVPYWDPKIANPISAGPGPGPGPGPITAADKAEARARAIAQWAINVVDFRDPDSIMTPFEYDVYPFAATTTWQPGELIRTWDVDDNISTDDDNPGIPGFERGIVWGCERPELLLTETLSFHDLGTKDTDDDPSGEDMAGGDADRDQFFRPKGSLFVEVYNPQSPSEARPAELYRDSTGTPTAGVVLNKATPAGNPVWRMAVTTRSGAVDPDKYQYLDPQEPNAAARTDAIQLERLVYFIPDNGNLPEMGPTHVTFYPSEATSISVEPRKYAVIGPATEQPIPSGGGTTIIGVTQIGHLTETGATAGATTRRIELNPAGTPQVAVYGNGSTEEVDSLATAGNIHPPLALRIDQPRRLSVSEPIAGYTTNPTTWSPVYQDYIFDPPLDDPLDYDTATQPEAASIFSTEATYPSYRYLHLQRLANPLLNWDAVSNPYITVDTAPVDLSVVNSDDNSSFTHNFYSRQRGETGAGLWSTTPPLLTEQPQPGAGKTTTGTPGDHAFAGAFCQSLGYVNHFFGDPINPADFGLSLEYRGAPAQITDPGGGNPKTLTPAPFAWFPWLNRPFANPLELMQVPITGPSQLTMSFETSAAASRHYSRDDEPFDHLLGFFGAWLPPAPADPPPSLPTGPGKMHQYRQLAGGASQPLTINVTAPHFYRILEYVQVPSRFVDSQIRGEPTLMAGGLHVFQPPFNFIPTWREPGKINLNTMVEPAVGQALANDYLDKMPAWQDFLATRRAYPVANATDFFGFEQVSAGTPPLPTRTANPFRSFAGAELVPPVPGRDSTVPGDPPFLTQLIQQGVNATLLRAGLNPAGGPGYTYTETLDARVPLFATLSTSDPGQMYYANPQTNASFQYQSLERLSNLVTNRSNVYAVWITIGYFQVEPVAVYNPATQDHIYPEGYTLGQELGIDTGDVTRRRAFYVIDRSIPVGFVPGEDLNSKETVLLKRFIE